MKRLLSLFTALLLCFTASACALETELPGSAESWLLPEGRASFAVSMQFEQLMPFGSATLEMLNRVLSHIAVSLSVTENSLTAAVYAGGAQTCLAEQTEDGSGTVLRTDLLKNRTLTSAGDAFSALLNDGADTSAAEEGSCPWSFSLPEALREAAEALPALNDAIAEFAEEKASNYTVKTVGTARWARSARLNREQCAQIHDALCAMLRAGFSDSYAEIIDQLVFSKQFTAAVYLTEEGGSIMAVSLKGRAKHPNGKYYDLSYQFAFTDQGTVYKVELGKGKRAGVNVSAKLTESAAYSYASSCSGAFRSEDGKTAWDFSDTAELAGAEKNGRSLKGTVSHSETVSGTTDRTRTSALTLKLKANGGILTGTAALKTTRDDNTLDNFSLTFSEPLYTQEPGALTGAADSQAEADASTVYDTSADHSGYLVGTPPVGVTAYTAPSAPVTVDVDSLSAEEREALQAELFQNAAGKLLVALLQNVPAEDLALLSDNVDEAAFQSLADRFFTVE